MLRTRLGRIIRDIRRRIVGKAELEAVFAWPLSCASQIRSQQQRQRGWKLYSFHAPEVECIGKGKASAPYEFGVKASIVSTNARAPGGRFVLHAKVLPGNPYDGHTIVPTFAQRWFRILSCLERMSVSPLIPGTSSRHRRHREAHGL